MRQKHEIECAGQGRRSKVYRIISRDEQGIVRYRSLTVYSKRRAEAVANALNAVEASKL